MSKIINIDGKVVKIGDDNGKIITVPITDLTFSNPKVGDQVEIYKDKNDVIVNLSKTKMAIPSLKKTKCEQKATGSNWLYCWCNCFSSMCN